MTVEQVHDRADDQGKEDGTDSPGDTQLGAKHLGRHHDGHDVDRRPRVEKGDGGAEPGTAPVDAAEQRQYGTGAHRQQRAGDRGYAEGDRLGRGRAEVLHHRALADIDGHRACDDEGRQQAKDDVLAGVPLGQAKAFEYGILEARLTQRQEEDQQKCGRHAKQHLGLARAVAPETRQVFPQRRGGVSRRSRSLGRGAVHDHGPAG